MWPRFYFFFRFLSRDILGPEYVIRFDSAPPSTYDAFLLVILFGYGGSEPVDPHEWRRLLYQCGRNFNRTLADRYPEVSGLIFRLAALWRDINAGKVNFLVE